MQEQINNMAEREFSDVIIHVGTNDLVKENAKTVSTKLERLIHQVKPLTDTVAISSVIGRSDGKVVKSSQFISPTKCIQQTREYKSVIGRKPRKETSRLIGFGSKYKILFQL